MESKFDSKAVRSAYLSLDSVRVYFLLQSCLERKAKQFNVLPCQAQGRNLRGSPFKPQLFLFRPPFVHAKNDSRSPLLSLYGPRCSRQEVNLGRPPRPPPPLPATTNYHRCATYYHYYFLRYGSRPPCCGVDLANGKHLTCKRKKLKKSTG